MGEVSYKPLIEDMTWSFSRIETYDSCKHRWFLKYIKEYEETDKFYASYGSFIHRLIEQYYRGQLKKEELLTEFLVGFSENVKGVRPQESTVNKYIDAGIRYFKEFKPFPYNMIDVEKKIEFKIDGIPFVGFIDFLGEKDGDYYIVDNKSRDLKHRSNRAKPTVKDIELDNMLKQLYIYSSAVKDEYGKFPKGLCFNCFKNRVFIEEPFNKKAYDDTVEWAKNTIEKIKNTERFSPSCDFFSCHYICGVNKFCYYDELAREERRSRK